METIKKWFKNKVKGKVLGFKNGFILKWKKLKWKLILFGILALIIFLIVVFSYIYGSIFDDNSSSNKVSGGVKGAASDFISVNFDELFIMSPQSINGESKLYMALCEENFKKLAHNNSNTGYADRRT